MRVWKKKKDKLFTHSLFCVLNHPFHCCSRIHNKFSIHFHAGVFFFIPTRLLRLLQMLEQDSGHSRLEPFRTYEALDQAAHNLVTNLQLARDSLAGARREQHYTVARLCGDCEALHRASYTDLQQLVLGPQVCPTSSIDQELLCPNAQVGVFLFTLL